ncbi:MAG TPA: glucose 1-dehydrogenase [Dehalococcoidia bacterium]|nr:glucose 1-dehydrogenase [Dehalococcoidia bacterium]
MDRLQDRVIFVTGAGRGIGRAIALRLASEGARVAVTDLDAETAAATAKEIGGTGGTAVGLKVDIASKESVVAGVAAAEEALGPIDVLVNNAGWDKVQPFLETTEDTWEKIIAINFVGPMNCFKTILPGMVERGGGTVVSVSSDAGRNGSSGEAVYSGAKAAVIGLSKTLAREMARHNININVVCPGPTETQLLDDVTDGRPNLREAFTRAVPFRRLGQPEDIANAVAFMASSDASYITGQTLSVSGGLTMM